MYCEGGRSRSGSSRSGRSRDRAHRAGDGRHGGSRRDPGVLAARNWKRLRLPRVTVRYGEPMRFERVEKPTREQQQAVADEIFAHIKAPVRDLEGRRGSAVDGLAVGGDLVGRVGEDHVVALAARDGVDPPATTWIGSSPAPPWTVVVEAAQERSFPSPPSSGPSRARRRAGRPPRCRARRRRRRGRAARRPRGRRGGRRSRSRRRRSRSRPCRRARRCRRRRTASRSPRCRRAGRCRASRR